MHWQDRTVKKRNLPQSPAKPGSRNKEADPRVNQEASQGAGVDAATNLKTVARAATAEKLRVADRIADRIDLSRNPVETPSPGKILAASKASRAVSPRTRVQEGVHREITSPMENPSSRNPAASSLVAIRISPMASREGNPGQKRLTPGR